MGLCRHAPPSFAAGESRRWNLWVLEHGLPGLPDQLGDGESVPVSWWVGPDTAAVLHLRRQVREGDPVGFTEVDVDLFERVGGAWEPGPGGGSGGWSDPSLVRVDVPADHADLSGVVGGAGLLGLWGEVGTAAAVLEVEQAGVVTRAPVVAPLGWAVVSGGLGQPFVVRVRDADGGLLAEHAVPPADW